jgi:hypothetical protein
VQWLKFGNKERPKLLQLALAQSQRTDAVKSMTASYVRLENVYKKLRNPTNNDKEKY